MEFPFADLSDLAFPALSFIANDPAARFIGHTSSTGRAWRDHGSDKVVLLSLSPRTVDSDTGLAAALSNIRTDALRILDLRSLPNIEDIGIRNEEFLTTIFPAILTQVSLFSLTIPLRGGCGLREALYPQTAEDRRGNEIALLSQLLPKVKSCQALTLDLSGDSVMASWACGAMAKTIAQINGLERLMLDLTDNVIDDVGCTAFAESFEEIEGLEVLNLCLKKNRVREKGCESLAKAFLKCRRLRSLALNLRSNRVGLKGCLVLVEALALCTRLKELSLDMGINDIPEEGAMALAVMLTKIDAELEALSLVLGNTRGPYIAYPTYPFTPLRSTPSGPNL